MADLLATPEDLASLLQQDVDTATATLTLEIATGIVQEAAGQRIIEVVDDQVTILGTVESWLALPQRPVTFVTLVELDGEQIAEAGVGADLNGSYRRFNDRLFRSCGWQRFLYAPSTVAFTYTHGYAPGAQELQLARGATLMLAREGYANPAGASSEQIDDYAIRYERMAARMEASPNVKAALRRQYGARAGLARIGGS